MPELVFVFVFGCCIGSFLNVCIYRMPLEKSLLWPGSRCGNCLQPVAWYDNIPLLSYLILRGRCRVCGIHFSVRYFLIEFLTGAGLAGLYYLEVHRNIHGFDPRILGVVRYETALRLVFLFHGLLFCFLVVATFCDIDHQIIPLPLTITGTLVGIAGAMLFPWPWPYTPAEAGTLARGYLARSAWDNIGARILPGLYPWPVWGPLPSWLAPGGNWQTGLETALAGALVGTLILRAVRLFFGIGAGDYYSEPAEPEELTGQRWFGARALSWLGRAGGRAMGLGDTDLMMMAGSFLGWQAIVVAFFLSVLPGLFFGLAQLVVRGGNVMPFGPALALGVLTTMLLFRRLVGLLHYDLLFFNGPFMLALAGLCCIGMLVQAYILRLIRVAWVREPAEEKHPGDDPASAPPETPTMEQAIEQPPEANLPPQPPPADDTHA